MVCTQMTAPSPWKCEVPYGCGSILICWGYAGFSQPFYLQGFHFGQTFLSHTHIRGITGLDQPACKEMTVGLVNGLLKHGLQLGKYLGMCRVLYDDVALSVICRPVQCSQFQHGRWPQTPTQAGLRRGRDAASLAGQCFSACYVLQEACHQLSLINHS